MKSTTTGTPGLMWYYQDTLQEQRRAHYNCKVLGHNIDKTPFFTPGYYIAFQLQHNTIQVCSIRVCHEYIHSLF